MTIPKTICMQCFTVLYDENPPAQPKKGDLCICIYCGHIMEFDEKLKAVTAKNPGESSIKLSFTVKALNRILGKDAMHKILSKDNNELNINLKGRK